mmetsp:Transcript_22638/g.41181  ORF Transcript_22638/g.41181 Transcript_22638/m.41181 type:complete len:86 (+) Transcript_22638:297-554(+)
MWTHMSRQLLTQLGPASAKLHMPIMQVRSSTCRRNRWTSGWFSWHHLRCASQTFAGAPAPSDPEITSIVVGSVAALAADTAAAFC